MSVCTCNMPDFQHAICPVHDVPATAGSCSEPRPDEEPISEGGNLSSLAYRAAARDKTSTYGGAQVAPAPKDGESVAGELSQSQEIPDGTVAHRQCQNSVAAPPPLSPAPEVPFSLPLRPHGQENHDNIDDADGWPVIIIYGNPDDPLTLRQMEYVVAAVNSHEELQRQRDEARNERNEIEQSRSGFAETAEQQKEELLKALEEAGAALLEMCEWHGGTHEYGCPADDTCSCKHKPFNDRVNEAGRTIDDILAKYKRGDQQ